MKAYSLDLRVRVLADGDAGMPTSRVAAKYKVSPSWVRQLKQTRRETGTIAPKRRADRKPLWTDEAGRIAAAVAETPDATLGELRARLGLKMSVPTLFRALRALKLTLKKKCRGRPSRSAPTSRSPEPIGSRGCRL